MLNLQAISIVTDPKKALLGVATQHIRHLWHSHASGCVSPSPPWAPSPGPRTSLATPSSCSSTLPSRRSSSLVLWRNRRHRLFLLSWHAPKLGPKQLKGTATCGQYRHVWDNSDSFLACNTEPRQFAIIILGFLKKYSKSWKRVFKDNKAEMKGTEKAKRASFSSHTSLISHCQS